MKKEEAIEKMANVFIERIKNLQTNWEKGWFGGKVCPAPQNYCGREYHSMNEFFLMMDTIDKGYKVPVYMTFEQVKKEGASIKKGEKSSFVFLWSPYYLDKDRNAIYESAYNQLSAEDKDKYEKKFFLKVHSVFNVDQTDLGEKCSDKYEKLLSKFESKELNKDESGMYVNEKIDTMIKDGTWVCPIKNEEQNRAFYSPMDDSITVPFKYQFRKHADDADGLFADGQEYYSSLIHEMAHSTGHKSRLNRENENRFGDAKYAKEELVAELTAAIVGAQQGFSMRVQDNNAAYLKSWLANIKKEPNFLVSVLSDVSKAVKMVNEHVA